MSKLASEQDVLDLLSLRGTTQATEAVGVALETATDVAAGLVGVENFDRETRLDRFTVTHEVYDLLGSGQPYGFLLANAFLPDPRIRVWQSSAAIFQKSTGTQLSRDSYLVDAENGVVTMTGRWVDQLCSVGAQYDCGFETSGDVYQDVPSWLQSGVLSVVVEIIRTHTITANKKDYLTDMSNQLTRMFRTTLYPHVRPRYQVVPHMHTEVL